MPSTRLEQVARRTLLDAAATSIETGLGLVTADTPSLAQAPPPLGEPRASFVTITIGGALRGCCGTLEPVRPLLHDVWRNAQASAFHDPRFLPLTAGEWREADLEVSVLTPHERLAVSSECELLLALVPGRDGVVLSWRGVRATFLPKVWEQVPDAAQFLAHLKQKAGWPADFWAGDLEVWRYETESMSRERR
jgi:AmmeMemoRadiSam system protein A